jgi:hypothetical protein
LAEILPAVPSIDYTDKDYLSLRRALLQFAQYRLPEWNDRSAADFGVLMVDLFAYVGDVVLYYQDRIADQSFLETATERRSVVNLLRLIGYELPPPVAASAELDLVFAPGIAAVTIPSGLRFRTVGLPNVQMFEYVDADLTLNLASDQIETLPDGRLRYRGLPVRQGTTVPLQVIGTSTGEPNQSFALEPGPVDAGTLRVEVNEGAGWIRWDRRDSLLYDIGLDGRIRLSLPDARHYYVRFDENASARVYFGDGRFGRRPPRGPNNVRASFRAGGGAAGNVPARTIRQVVGAVENLVEMTNPEPAAGGQDAESITDAARFGPLAFRSRGRAVTESDYQAMAHLAGGVAKARARARSWNVVDLYVAPAGESCRPVPETLRRRLLAFFEDRRMAGTFVRVLDPVCVPIDISVEVAYDERFRADAVRQQVEEAVRGQLAFERVDFGQAVYLSAVHNAIEDVPGVRLVTLTRFKRRDSDDDEIARVLAAHNLPPLEQLPALVRDALRREIEADGRIELAFFEIAVTGELEIRTVVSPR